MNKMKMSQYSLVIFLSILAIISLLPFMWIISTSLRLPSESFKMPPSFFPTSFQWSNYAEVFKKFPVFTFFKNSLYVVLAAGILNVIVTTMAAFAFSRIKFKGRDTLFVIVLAGMMIPFQATIIPNFVIMSKFKLVGSLWALILPAIVTPISIFFVRQHMLTIPKSYEESAYIDGASIFRVYCQIIVPMSKPVIAMTSVMSFLFNWNNFIGPLIYLSEWETMTIPMGLRVLTGYMGTGSIAVIFAGLALSLIPPFVFYLFAHKYIVKGVTLSGLKS